MTEDYEALRAAVVDALEDLDHASERARVHQDRQQGAEAPPDAPELDPRRGGPLAFTEHIEDHIDAARRKLLAAIGPRGDERTREAVDRMTGGGG